MMFLIMFSGLDDHHNWHDLGHSGYCNGFETLVYPIHTNYQMFQVEKVHF